MTTTVDTFDRANGALGTTSDGTATWTVQSGSWSITSNQALAGSTSRNLATIPGSANGQVATTVAATGGSGNGAGVLFRYQDTSNYWRVLLIGATGGQLQKRVAATDTQVGSTFTMTTGDKVRVIFNGSALTCYVNEVQVLTTTDSALSTATVVGIGTTANTGGTVDSFSYDSSTTPPAGTPWRRPSIVTRSRAVARASVI